MNTNNLKKISLDGDNLSWVSEVKHVGHVLQADNSMKVEIAQKRGAFIGKVNSLLQEFPNVSPSVFIKLMHFYAAAVYCSSLWDLFSTECEQLYESYNVTIRNVINVFCCTHRYFIEPLSKVQSFSSQENDTKQICFIP